MEIKVFVSNRIHLPPSLPVHSYGQQATHRCHHRDADHGVKHVVHLPDEVILHHQLSVVEEVNNDGLPGVGHTHQHVRYSQTATTKQVRSSLNHNDRCSQMFLFMYILDTQVPGQDSSPKHLE